ncbi:MAG: energy transducer TonB [Deltaproteobacteria bacterium]|nr:energy transducer TonB [Deltaproteobacteria bacterium]
MPSGRSPEHQPGLATARMKRTAVWAMALVLALATTVVLLLGLPLLAIEAPQHEDEERSPGVALSFDIPPERRLIPEATRPKDEDERYAVQAPNISSPKIFFEAEALVLPGLGQASSGMLRSLDIEPSLGLDMIASLSLPGELEFEAAELDFPPVPIRQIPPQYPYLARSRGLSGRVELRFLVGVEGLVSDVSIESSTPPGIFDRSAVEAVSQWRFSPGRYRGEAVRAWVRLPIKFELN